MKIFGFLRKDKPEPQKQEAEPSLEVSPEEKEQAQRQYLKKRREELLLDIQARFQENVVEPMKHMRAYTPDGMAMDSTTDNATCTGLANSERPGALIGGSMSPTALTWYGSHYTIGFQASAIVAQHWLVNKACDMPGRDAVRNGWTINFNDGAYEVDAETAEKLRKLDKAYKIKQECRK